MHDLGDRWLIGVGEIEDLRRLAIQPVSQFLDCLHVAACSLFDVHPCDLAQFLQWSGVLASRDRCRLCPVIGKAIRGRYTPSSVISVSLSMSTADCRRGIRGWYSGAV